MQKIPEPLTIFLIGVTGDLAKKKILKAVYKLFEKGLLSAPFNLIGNARKPMLNDEFKQFVKEIVKPESDASWNRFSGSLSYVAGDSTKPETFEVIAQFHQQLAQDKHCGNHIWYIATLPQLYLSIVQNIKRHQMHTTECGWTKILIEKPFGTNLISAQALNEELTEVFTEDQIYRIDHFLGKETVQNLVAFRFANGLFEDLWNKNTIDHIQVTLSETLGVTGREEFYDATGATRDTFQNHLLQMIAVTLMEEPTTLSADDIRHSRSQLLRQITFMEDANVHQHVVFGQYETGVLAGQIVPGYTEEKNIAADSQTETALALKLAVNNDRWRGVPIYIRTGKRLAAEVLEISIQFKDPKNKMFNTVRFGPDPNILTFRFQPNEAIILRLFVKKPGHGIELDMVPMEFNYHNQYRMNLIEAYERLIHDASLGDSTLFPDAESIETSWKIVDQILSYKPDAKLAIYQAGSWGPDAFDTLIEQDGRKWLEPTI